MQDNASVQDMIPIGQRNSQSFFAFPSRPLRVAMPRHLVRNPKHRRFMLVYGRLDRSSQNPLSPPRRRRIQSPADSQVPCRTGSTRHKRVNAGRPAKSSRVPHRLASSSTGRVLPPARDSTPKDGHPPRSQRPEDIQRRCAYFSFFALAPLTFAVPRRVFCRFFRCLPARVSQHNTIPANIRTMTINCREIRRVRTYAAACWHARAWFRGQHGRDGTGARTSSWPRGSRRRGRSRWSCRHRTGCADQRRRSGPSGPCTCRRACRGAHPWRCWRGWGAGCHYRETRSATGSLNRQQFHRVPIPPAADSGVVFAPRWPLKKPGHTSLVMEWIGLPGCFGRLERQGRRDAGRARSYSHNHLLATQERVADELASSQGNGGVVVRHGGLWLVSAGGWLRERRWAG